MTNDINIFASVRRLRLALLSFTFLVSVQNSMATPQNQEDLLIKMAPGFSVLTLMSTLSTSQEKMDFLGGDWVRLQASQEKKWKLQSLKKSKIVELIQPNYPIRLLESYRIEDPLRREIFKKKRAAGLSFQNEVQPTDNLEIPNEGVNRDGDDPEYSKQWGMSDIQMQEAWKFSFGDGNITVAVIDTGVDYSHEDLAPNLWRNPGESGVDAQGNNKASNGIDDDGNGYVDDLIGWDFVQNDNRPYDLTVPAADLLLVGGNPGHGTHCAGNVGARGHNALGISGVAPRVKIMPVRFISEKATGTTADAIKAIRYAVDAGAKVLSNSWGSEGEDASDTVGNLALREAIQYAQDKGVIFVAAAGNGHWGVGYDNDTDPSPAYPASYTYENIISVAAIDNKGQLGGFSNWGRTSVDVAAPGVRVFSTTVGNKYSDKVLDSGGFDFGWDGTSMAAPHVAGAVALYWSTHPQKTWQEVKAAVLASAHQTPSLQGKLVSEGKLDVRSLMNQP